MRSRNMLKYLVIFVLLLFIGVIGFGKWARQALVDDQPQWFAEPVVDNTAPALPDALFANENPSILVFSKTNGFRHRDAIGAAQVMFESMAGKNNWNYFYTENAAVYSSQNMQKFDVVIWSNATNPALTPDQRAAFKAYLSNGGGFVGIHSAGDSSHESWPWYQSQVIRANFTGHPMFPQFQVGEVTTEDNSHPAMAHFSEQWQHEEEWYCFAASPRENVNVLATLDETDMSMMALKSLDSLIVSDLAMGEDHPVIWNHDVGKGRVFYSALGHGPESYQNDSIVKMLEEAVIWSGRL